ncbi:MAG: SUMF1/EgtB/PvdO family nonheme iron enzyme [Blastocatellia bacterium]|nr:SUMF1/EgtB/PvdO family nonheme iron enzyme [Blastocatellia bacterium]
MKECQLCKNCYGDDVATCPKDGMPTMHTIPGEPVLEGKYQIESRLGQGGMGVVYKARHAYLKTQLAIKIILPDLVGNDPQLVTRFRQEALAAAAIRHQNVVAVTDYGVLAGSIPFLVMEYVEGEALHDLLTREKVLDPEKAFEVMSAICSGVGAAHHQGIVHRDLKPLNIMICSGKPNMSQAVKILDFGLAKIKSGELLGSFIQAQTTGLMGSPYYMAPEQWADDEPDSRSDIYSLGVILFQMLAGDVPFKGSSIPAIMKKHISDPAPRFSEVGVTISPELEAAVLRTLHKEKDKRTESVEAMIADLREAIFPSAIGIHTASGASGQMAAVNIKTDPPESLVFVDSVPVGQSRDDGWITLNGLQSGSHNLKISKEGYQDWYGDVVIDGKPKQVVAELQSSSSAIPRPPAATIAYPGGISPNTPQNFSNTQDHDPEMLKTRVQGNQTGEFVDVPSQPKKNKLFSPVVLGTAGALLFLVISGFGVAGLYMAGAFSGVAGSTVDSGNVANTAKPTPVTKPEPRIRAEMVQIPGGSFTMGSNSRRENEKPEHPQTVGSFWMDKTEVTNESYHEFIEVTGHRPMPVHWENEKPRPGEEKMPVRYVSQEDAKAFAEWLSERDNLRYRLPTEIEWEYAARNGAKNNVYPWGDKWDRKCAFLDHIDNSPKNVGEQSCPNDWGVADLIGNVFEWTSTEAMAYPGSPFEIVPRAEPFYMVRGGGAFYKSSGDDRITSTFRTDLAGSTRSPGLGFRLVRDE